ncbi:hypothetical protein JBE04_21120, partial [Streptomyces sp. PRKS01-29]
MDTDAITPPPAAITTPRAAITTPRAPRLRGAARHRRRRLLGSLAAAGLLTACGTQSPSGVAAVPDEATSRPAGPTAFPDTA